MDGELIAPPTSATEEPESPLVEATSAEYLGRWNRLVSTTNWEKGRIIHEWRQALVAAGAPTSSYSDEAWSRRAGGVTPQHTGRLRRVHHQFAEVRQSYTSLYWSHFQAALDWNDAEMWLEGAVRSDWSVAQMQQQRAGTLDRLVEPAPVDDFAPEPDDDLDDGSDDALTASLAEVHPAADESEEISDEPSEAAESFADVSNPPIRPLEKLPPLPADLQDAFEAFKLAIIGHRLSQWREVSCDDVLVALDALRQLALAPADG
jgi:hypothetical protein